MKTKKQIADESIILDENDILTLDEFQKLVKEGTIGSSDGVGYFHDGEKETDINVWDDTLTYDDVKDYPYICWYNK